LDIIPVLDGVVTLKAEHLKPDPPRREVVFGVGKHVIAVGEDAHEIDPRRAFGESAEKRRQTRAPRLRLRIVLHVLARMDDLDAGRVSRFDALEQRANAVLSRFGH